MRKTALHRSKHYRARTSVAKPVLSPVPTPGEELPVALQNTITQQTNIEETQKLQMRWCAFWIGAALCGIGMVTGIIGSIALFYVLKYYVAASVVLTASIALPLKFLHWCSKHLIPMDENRFYLEQIKIQTRGLIMTALVSRNKVTK